MYILYLKIKTSHIKHGYRSSQSIFILFSLGSNDLI